MVVNAREKFPIRGARAIASPLIHPRCCIQVMAVDYVGSGWTVESLLQRVALASNGYKALIDTGALVTGMTNVAVARFLLGAGLDGLDGVVFLDEADRKMILLRDGRVVLPLEQCGVDKAKRFSFYDQVHTTVRGRTLYKKKHTV